MASVILTNGNERSSTLGSFLTNLPELLGAFSQQPGPLVAICERVNGNYVQFWIEGDEILAEFASNAFSNDRSYLTLTEETELRARGWIAPMPGVSPNWHVRHAGRDAPVAITRLVVETIAGSLSREWRAGTEVRVRTFRSRRAEDSNAA